MHSSIPRRSPFWVALLSSAAIAACLGALRVAQGAVIPIGSTDALGALSLGSGTIRFDTDPADPGAGTYAINGITQAGNARVVTLPPDNAYAPGNPGGPASNYNVYVWDFSSITLGSGVTVSDAGPLGLILLASGGATVNALFPFAGAAGAAGGPDNGGGGGAGGGSLSIFAGTGLSFGGNANVHGGNGGASFTVNGTSAGGSASV